MFNFKQQKNKTQAVRFYVGWFILGLILFVILDLFDSAHYVSGKGIANILAENGMDLPLRGMILYTSFLSLIVINTKNLYKEHNIIFLFILTVFFTYIGGLVFGLIPCAMLTTFGSNINLDNKNKNKNVNQNILKCPKCNTLYSVGDNFCENCGTKLN